MLNVDVEQIRKYNVPGPRYTSYPTAVHFDPSVRAASILPEIRENNRTAGDLSLYVHVPFCESLCWYCGCNTYITRNHGKAGVYLDYLEKEINVVAPMMNPQRRVVQLHWGGGTPTFLDPEEIERLGNIIRSRFHYAQDLEASVELDPRRLGFEHISALRGAGFNRASLGVQDFDPFVQNAVNRIQSFEMTAQVADWLRAEGFQSLAIDLIYGLPFQTVHSFEQTLDKVLSLEPDRLAVFSYAHVPWMKPAQRLLNPETMPSPETKLAILELTVAKLTHSGYVYIGMDHFARRGDELQKAQKAKTLQRNFQGYSTHAGADIYSFGVSSISQTPNAYWQNEKKLTGYYFKLEQGELPIHGGYFLTEDDRIRRSTIMRLMCDMSLDYHAMSDRLGIDFARFFANEIASLRDLERDGLLHRNSSGFALTDCGRLLVRNVAMRFDAYIDPQATAVYSRTI